MGWKTTRYARDLATFAISDLTAADHAKSHIVFAVVTPKDAG
jgi:hypothetical protein